MASKKFIELKEFSSEDLSTELRESELGYQKSKFDNATKGMDNPLVLKEMRRDIARLNTEIRRREILELTPEQLAMRSKIRFRRRKK